MKKTCFLLVIFLTLYSCQTDEVYTEEEIQNPIIPEEPDEGEDDPDRPSASVKGFYLLNEGNMSMNKASLDFMDYETGEYKRNVFSQANPDLVGGLGDVGNDIGIYGSKLYVVVNAS